MLAHEPEQTSSPQPQIKDYSSALCYGMVALAALFLVSIVVVYFTIGYDVDLTFLTLAPIFGLALLTTVVGVLLLSRPLRVRKLAYRLSARFSRISSPQEWGIIFFWASAYCWFQGILLVALSSGHPISGKPGFVAFVSFFLISLLAYEIASLYFRRRLQR